MLMSNPAPPHQIWFKTPLPNMLVPNVTMRGGWLLKVKEKNLRSEDFETWPHVTWPSDMALCTVKSE